MCSEQSYGDQVGASTRSPLFALRLVSIALDLPMISRYNQNIESGLIVRCRSAHPHPTVSWGTGIDMRSDGFYHCCLMTAGPRMGESGRPYYRMYPARVSEVAAVESAESVSDISRRREWSTTSSQLLKVPLE